MQFHYARRFVPVALTIVVMLGLVVFFSPRAALSASAHVLQSQRPHSGAGAVSYTHVATSANTTGYWTELDNKVTNNQSGAWVIAMPNRSASSNGRVVDNHPIAVWYDAMMGRWAIINQDKASIPVGAAFNVFAVPQSLVQPVNSQSSVNSSSSATVFGAFSSIFAPQNRQSGNTQSEELTLVASSSNSKGNWTYIDSTVTNGNPNAFVNATVNWSAKGVYDPHPVGAFYDATAQKWAIFNEGSIDPIPQGSAFNLLVDSSINGLVLHTSTASNTSGNHTAIDESSQLSSSPQAIVFVTPNFNPGGLGGGGHDGAYEPHNLGVSYQDGQWVIFNEDNAAMSTDVSFNVIATSFTPTPTA